MRSISSGRVFGSGELSEVTGQLADAERELADVRALLAELREQTFS